jgi:hypothetical protein
MTDRSTKERKLMALIISDLELNLEEAQMIEVGQEVRSLPDEELDRTLASRLDLPYPVDEQEMGQALTRIEVPELALKGELGGDSGTTEASRKPRAGEHRG